MWSGSHYNFYLHLPNELGHIVRMMICSSLNRQYYLQLHAFTLLVTLPWIILGFLYNSGSSFKSQLKCHLWKPSQNLSVGLVDLKEPLRGSGPRSTGAMQGGQGRVGRVKHWTKSNWFGWKSVQGADEPQEHIPHGKRPSGSYRGPTTWISL